MYLSRQPHCIDSVAQANSGIASMKKSVFVGNIPFDASEESLRQVFALGTSGGNDGIVNVRIVRDRSKFRQRIWIRPIF